MCEALVAARTDFPLDGGTDAQWRWALGHMVIIRPDNFAWGALEDPRNFATAAERRFALFRFPGISIARVERYLAQHTGIDQFSGKPTVIRNRLWQIQWATLPLAARTILVADGVLTIGPASVGGDFTWSQVKAFVVRLDTGAGETEELT